MDLQRGHRRTGEASSRREQRVKEAFLETAEGCDRKSDQTDEDNRNNEQEWQP